ncbi:MAG: phosphate acyltransferase PlsX [Dehalococcoidia bacterium]|uniref:phosphate acyltransferase PlsX n=1 Tax=Candidatus Amarobacter glycogenicus TaxID=3140699 RepID=UPI002A121087|nr:phosphate acyltransferase PlsX [Dehalococcoidia bacterium]MBK7124764.1 phosphate acyltransferase PlsX [Dehalococcoidia bacterium]MBK7329950.1 phosphate acyltransferase PlsX [Dehalococcoidia bacterium]MBK8559985.1 phosphate acyltransferase PlsX [Dehalococcoidia bacterium]MBK9342273.1 phosphate acyltransferase PlsX [Dehalococcoidia bacterium]
MTARIVVDAMGGDNAPGEIVAGALMAAGGLGVDLILVGRKAAIEAELEGAQAKNLKIIDAADVIEMDEHPTEAVKNKPESSINVGMRMVKSGQADAFVTAGNTGASMAAAMLTLGRIKGIGRPALATIFPTGEGRLTMLLDVGANADCRPIHLLQFAYMGAAYMERMFKVQNPKVGLLSIGEEDSKGNQLTVEVNQALRASRLNFMGNVEGKDLTRGVCDVAVMDGFTGNVVLKTAEGMAELLLGEIRKAVELTPWNRAAGLILMSELRKVKRRLDYAEYGGAQLVGVEGIVVIGHGRSNARAVFSAIRAARDAVDNKVVDTLRGIAKEIPAKTTKVGSGDATDDGDD